LPVRATPAGLIPAAAKTGLWRAISATTSTVSAPHRRSAREGRPTVNPSAELLRHSGLCAGLDDDGLARAAGAAVPLELPAGATACRRGEPADRVCVLTAGRLLAASGDADDRVVGRLEPGDSFGEYAALESGAYNLTITAQEDSRLLAIPADDFRSLFSEVPGIGRNVILSLGRRLRHAYGLDRQPGGPRTIAAVGSGPAADALVRLLTDELTAHGARATAFDADADADADAGPSDGGDASTEARLARLSASHDRVFVRFAPERLSGGDRLPLFDEVLRLAAPGDEAALRRRLDAADLPVAVAARSRVVWVLPPGGQVAPAGGIAGVGRPFVVELPDADGRSSPRQRAGVRRLARHIRGVTLGLALAGGGARGMAHLGVFRALERSGIDFDLIAGTSAGALVGAVYAAGYSPEFCIEAFTRELSAPRWLGWMPGGRNWHLTGKFRSGAWEPTLRRYLFDWTLDRLPVPFRAVAVDLISGREVVRDAGDATRAVLESINLPVISPPICREGRALVDGAVLNNLPADVLTSAGADLVAGVDVSSRLRPEFAGNTPETPTERMRPPGFLETLLRVFETQSHGLSSLRIRSVDVMIEPDTSAFDFADFSRAAELARAGEAAAEAALPALRRALAECDRRAARSAGRVS
jgi:predicted acylesterase/phospholipase RssA/CRP-like cAMP-binding protein